MRRFVSRIARSGIADQFPRFFLVGFLAFATDAIILQTLVSFAAWDAYWARVPSALSAIAVSWVLNRRYTFKLSSTHPKLRSIVNHVTATGIGLAVNLLVYWSCIALIPGLQPYPVVALALGSAVGLFINYLLAKYWVFHQTEHNN